MRFILTTLLVLFLCLGGASVFAFDDPPSWDNSPRNWDNSLDNFDNSPNNWRNNPRNWNNSPDKYNNDRIIRDNRGNPKSYIVPKPGGGANIYDFDGNRKSYIPE